MNSRGLATLGASVFVMALVQFFSALAGLWIALCVALVLPFIALGLLKFFEVEPGPVWMVLTPVAGSALGVVIWAVAQTRGDPLIWACPVLAWAMVSGVVWYRNRDARRCGLCNGGIAGGISFECPRCGLTVCEHKCWDFDKLRCKLCVQNQVPALTDDGRWWDRNFGPRTPHGRCQMCQTAAAETDLRNCPKCGRPQCRGCWDDANGACSRCQWKVADLPERLKAFLGQ